MAEREKPAGYARSEAKNAEVRATLTPLEPGERPLPLLIAIGVAIVLAAVNLVGTIISDDVPLVGTIIFCVVMGMAAYGLWNQRAWAVLGFLALLGIILAFATLSLLVASNLAAVAFCVALIAGAGTLFWKLIRVLGRIQAPPR
ncbi:hypothetical protein LRS13_05155 [Svornostia abyssi]|uniref:Uncharacterized protein n=1 Tax=Svornostia abyssi TaxID=2898438 RepID=A0ABY5PJQ7_9ACTN|nr:hypothetical protein LRS13_05155 [Parviterribacteraceae bacterium J379]